MKSQRRHDLQTNTLADNLAETLDYLKTQTRAILLGIVAVVVIIAAVWYWQYTSAARRGRAGRTCLPWWARRARRILSI